ncbi:phosphate binding [Micractinium conductrix]|uniref:Phosphate binding n=1 Tax=Micractinium conductrix TaxID=554055 RepID=A0A2P6VB36_9CHLO|nr:phosphate binding [Micractinium conductrix]|eukprot:PSC71261.1 phosphate binding [Micractinium conductrix]
MTNGCLPASLLLRDVLTARGVPCRLRSGYSVVTLSEEGSPPPLYAAAHMWVEVQGGSGGGGGAGSGAASLDIGLALAQTADAKVASYQLATELPAGAKRIDESEGAGMMEAVMAALADRADAGAYWAGAPPALQQFRAAMLQRFAA